MGTQQQINQGTITFSQEGYIPLAVQAFLLDRRIQNMSAGTIHFYQVKLRLFLDFCEGQVIKHIEQITPDGIRLYLLHLEETNHNPGGIHAAYRTLRAFLYWYEQEYEPAGWKNPIRKVKAPMMASEPLEPVSSGDFGALLTTCDKTTWHGIRDAAILKTLLDSGLRAAELIALDVVDVDSMTGAVFVKSGKGRKPRTCFIGKDTRRAVRQWLRRRGDRPGALFTTREGERLTYWGLRQIVRRRADSAGIAAPGVHDFRRAFCLAQLQAGVSETTIARLMGHTTTQLITRYAKQTAANLQELYRSPVDGERDSK